MISALLLTALLPLAQTTDPCASIRSAKDKTYGFRPMDLDTKAREGKSSAMDAFWGLVKNDKTAGVTCLRELLSKEEKDGFFLFDGASLLFDTDSGPASLSVIKSSLLRSDLSQVDPGAYVNMAFALSRKGVDIVELARRYMELDKADAFIPAHSLRLERWMGGLFLYGSMPADEADRNLVELLKSSSTEARGAAALVLAINMTETGLKELSSMKGFGDLPAVYRQRIAEMRSYEPYKAPEERLLFTRTQVLDAIQRLPHTREEFEKALDRQAEYEAKVSGDALKAHEEGPPFIELDGHTRFIESAMATLTEADLPAIREARRKAVHGISDESLYEYFTYTAIIQSVLNRLDLYKTYRRN